MTKLLLSLSTALLLSSCSVTKEMSATGGSKSDGTVKLSYTYNSFEQPTVDRDNALATAVKRCKAWGYKDAEPFDGSLKSCSSGSAYGCSIWMVTREYQCLGDG